jgi:Ca2+-binding RTX toxin-like protein
MHRLVTICMWSEVCAMLVAGGLLILMAMGFALGGMAIDAGTDPQDDDDDGFSGADPDTADMPAENTVMLDDLMFEAGADGPPGDAALPGLALDALLDGGTGDDVLRARLAMQDVFSGNGDDAVTGGPNGDTLLGGAETDAFFGNEGDDNLQGQGGADELYGDDGNDTLLGGAGRDFLVGGDGDDSLSGGDDGDLMFGGDGDDLLAGDGGDDFLQGGFGADHLLGGAGHDWLDGSFTAGASLFATGDQDQGDVLDGGDGDDTILIGAGDLATGGAGADIFRTGSYITSVDLAGHVSDFDPAQDMIELLYDPEQTPDPIVTVVDFDDGSGASILFNGTVVLTVSGAQGLDPAAIELRLAHVDPVSDPV